MHRVSKVYDYVYFRVSNSVARTLVVYTITCYMLNDMFYMINNLLVSRNCDTAVYFRLHTLSKCWLTVGAYYWPTVGNSLGDYGGSR